MSQSKYRQRLRDRSNVPDGGGINTSFVPTKLGRVTLAQQKKIKASKETQPAPPVTMQPEDAGSVPPIVTARQAAAADWAYEQREREELAKRGQEQMEQERIHQEQERIHQEELQAAEAQVAAKALEAVSPTEGVSAEPDSYFRSTKSQPKAQPKSQPKPNDPKGT